MKTKRNRTMNKLLGTVLTSALTISLLAGCGTSTSNKKKVGIIQFMDHTSLNEIKDSFDKEMKTLGYDDKNCLLYTSPSPRDTR